MFVLICHTQRHLLITGTVCSTYSALNVPIFLSYFLYLVHQGGRKQTFYGGATVNSEKRIFKKFPTK